jgi:hypothetical protein
MTSEAERVEEVERTQFVGWIADRFQQRHATPLAREEAESMAEACLAGFEDMDSIQFGDPSYSWGEDDAHDFADEEIYAGWESA